jgi:hypothetical protein
MERTRDPLKLYMQRTKYLYAIFISAGRRPILLAGSFLQKPTNVGVEEAMSWMPIEWARRATSREAKSPVSKIPTGLRIAGTVLRTIFIVAVLLVTLRVSMPQSETFWTVYETPGDLIRLALGLAVCVWLVAQLFTVPKDAQAYRTWLYLGLAAVPFALICVFAVW